MAQLCNCAVAHRVTEERSRDIRKASQLVDKIRTLGGLEVRDRSYHLRTYRSCFVASELVEWFVASGEADDRSQATELGQLLVDTDYIHHVVDEHRLEDAYLFFRFRQDEPPELAMQGPSVAYMRGQEGALISTLARRRLVLGWTYYTFVLSPGNKTLYQYRSELDSVPLNCVQLEGCSVLPQSPNAAGKHTMCILNHNKDKVVSLSADSGDTLLTWLRALEGAGLEVLPNTAEVDEQVKTAQSIFEFEAKDIDGNLVSLNQYRGHVTLVVNVASQ